MPELQNKMGYVVKCQRVFSPSAPIDRKNLFAGRTEQIIRITNAINTRGKHCVMYGDRGVGKTSLATILKELFESIEIEGIRFYKINCVESDDFQSVWRRMLSEIQVLSETFPVDGEASLLETTLDSMLGSDPFGPGEVRQLLQRQSSIDFELVIIFDEFDRLDNEDRAHFADVIKDLSDNSVNTTILLVGVAKDVLDLISEHSSIDRCLDQVLMPLMQDGELSEILSKAMNALGTTLDHDAERLIVALSQGLPHYTHLLGQESTLRAINNDRLNVTIKDVEDGIKEAIDKSQQSVRTSYHEAVRAQRKGTLFTKVLLACALAEADELGFFNSTDVRDPFCEIAKKKYDIPSYSGHLDKFSTDESRGPILEKTGTSRRYRFKFRNPLLRPFVIMKGLTDGLITGDLITRIQAKQASRASKSEFQNQLFND